ncbi:mitochondrial fission factor isoform X1 [Prionailurus iriomotensis]
MSGAAFPSPRAAEMAEISRIQYEMEYTEGISQQMRVPERLKVAPPNADLEQGFQEGAPNASVVMQVPERIVVAGNNEDIPFARPADLDLIQSTPFKPLALKTPPRVLTLSERPLDFLDLERPPATPQNEEVLCVKKVQQASWGELVSVLPYLGLSEEIRAVGRLKRERSMSENAVRPNGQLLRADSIFHELLVHEPHLMPGIMLASPGTTTGSGDGASLSEFANVDKSKALKRIFKSTRAQYRTGVLSTVNWSTAQYPLVSDHIKC